MTTHLQLPFPAPVRHYQPTTLNYTAKRLTPFQELNPQLITKWDLHPADHLHQVTQRRMNRGELKAEVLNYQGQMVPCYANLNLWTTQMIQDEFYRLTGIAEADQEKGEVFPRRPNAPELWKVMHPLNSRFLGYADGGFPQMSQSLSSSMWTTLALNGTDWIPLRARDLLSPSNRQDLTRICQDFLDLLDRALWIYQATQATTSPLLISTDPRLSDPQFLTWYPAGQTWDRESLVSMIKPRPQADYWTWAEPTSPHRFLKMMIEVDQFMRTSRMPRLLPPQVAEQLHNNWLMRTPQDLMVSFKIPPITGQD